MQVLRLSTASQVVLLGPFVDNIDGATAKTSLSIAASDIKIRKHGSTSFANKNSGGATHIANGYYHATFDATDSNTLGLLDIVVNMSGCMPVRHSFMVMQADSYDALFHASDGRIRANLSQWLGSAPNALVSGRVDASVGAMASGVVTAAAIATDAITADKIAADAVGSSELAASAVQDIIDGVLDEALAGHLTPGTVGEAISDAASGGSLTVQDIVDGVWDEAIASHAGAGSMGEALNTAAASGITPAEVRQEIIGALSVDTYPEPTTPPAWPMSVLDMHRFLMALGYNKRVQTQTQQTIRNAADSSDIATSQTVATGGQVSRGRWV